MPFLPPNQQHQSTEGNISVRQTGLPVLASGSQRLLWNWWCLVTGVFKGSGIHTTMQHTSKQNFTSPCQYITELNCWWRPLGLPQNNWLDQLRYDSNGTTGDLWKGAVCHRHCGVMTWCLSPDKQLQWSNSVAFIKCTFEFPSVVECQQGHAANTNTCTNCP